MPLELNNRSQPRTSPAVQRSRRQDDRATGDLAGGAGGQGEKRLAAVPSNSRHNLHRAFSGVLAIAYAAAYNSRMLQTRDILDTAQVAGLLGLSVVRVQQFCKQGRLGALVGGRYLITRREVYRFAKIARPAGNPQFRAVKK